LQEVEAGRLSACVRIDEIRAEMQAVRREVRAPAVLGEVSGNGAQPFLAVRDLRKVFPGRGGAGVHALDAVSLEVRANESVGVVGESGSGKTTLGRCLVGLETPTAGTIDIDGIAAADYSKLTRADRARLRRTVQIVFQDPYSSLDPTETVG